MQQAIESMLLRICMHH